MSKPTRSKNPAMHPLEATAGVLYYPRMLAKIRLHAASELWEDLQANPGKGMDDWCVGFLHVDYKSLKKRTLEGDSNEKILA